MAKPGRKTKHKPEYDKKAQELTKQGYTDKDLAKYFHVTEQSINNWKHAYPQFFESLKKGKDIADQKVVASLYQRACSYSHPDVHVTSYEGDITVTPIIKHYPPDPTACIFWLKNRRPGEWRDKVETELSGKDGSPIQVQIIDSFKSNNDKNIPNNSNGKNNATV